MLFVTLRCKLLLKLYLLSRFPGDRTVDSRRTKKESSSSRQELQVETGIEEFRKNLGGRGFSPTLFHPYLGAILMVEVFGVGIAVQFSPKD